MYVEILCSPVKEWNLFKIIFVLHLKMNQKINWWLTYAPV